MSEDKKIKKSIKDLKVGDKVWIKNGLIIGEEYGDDSFIDEMLCGCEILVEDIFKNKIGNDLWNYTPEMIDWDKTNEINISSDNITEENLLNQEFAGADQTRDFNKPFAIEYDAEWIIGKVRGFEKVSQEQFEESLHGTIYEEEASFLYDEIKLPKRGTKHSAGYDVFSPFEFTLEPNEVIKIPTGIKAYMQVNEFIAGYPRSSKGFKFFMRLANTVAIGDSDYYDNIKNEGHYFIKIRNEGKKTMHIEKGEAFAQFVFQSYLLADYDSFNEGEERKGGVGSTDK